MPTDSLRAAAPVNTRDQPTATHRATLRHHADYLQPRRARALVIFRPLETPINFYLLGNNLRSFSFLFYSSRFFLFRASLFKLVSHWPSPMTAYRTTTFCAWLFRALCADSHALNFRHRLTYTTANWADSSIALSKALGVPPPKQNKTGHLI